MDPVERRKAEHVDLTLRPGSAAAVNPWDDVRLLHEAAPETDLDRIDLRTTFLGRDLGAPLMVASMTGGYAGAADVNAALAEAAAKHQVALGVGSQRAALQRPDLEPTYQVVRQHDVPLVAANIGAPQLVRQGAKDALKLDDIDRVLSMVEADILIVHLNALQEAVQPGGDLAMEGVLRAIERVAEHVDIPVLAKETGAGMHRRTVARLVAHGAAAVDVGGYGGTSFALVEAARAAQAGDADRTRRGEHYGNWGIPTPVSVLEAVGQCPVVATGGLRHGLDAARALALGADMAGVARTALEAAAKGPAAATEAIRAILDDLRVACFLTGSPEVETLKRAPVTLTGATRALAQDLGHDLTRLGARRLDA